MSESVVDAQVEPVRVPALRFTQVGMHVIGLNGEAVTISVDDIVAKNDPALALAWANVVLQKDLIERMSMQTQALTQLAQVLGALQARAAMQDPAKIVEQAMGSAVGLLKELMKAGGR